MRTVRLGRAGGFDRLAQGATVGQAGQLVVPRLVPQLRLASGQRTLGPHELGDQRPEDDERLDHERQERDGEDGKMRPSHGDGVLPGHALVELDHGVQALEQRPVGGLGHAPHGEQGGEGGRIVDHAARVVNVSAHALVHPVGDAVVEASFLPRPDARQAPVHVAAHQAFVGRLHLVDAGDEQCRLGVQHDELVDALTVAGGERKHRMGEARRALAQHALAAGDVDDGRRMRLRTHHVVHDRERSDRQERDQAETDRVGAPHATAEARHVRRPTRRCVPRRRCRCVPRRRCRCVPRRERRSARAGVGPVGFGRRAGVRHGAEPSDAGPKRA